jgi:hypothetical protein
MVSQREMGMGFGFSMKRFERVDRHGEAQVLRDQRLERHQPEHAAARIEAPARRCCPASIGMASCSIGFSSMFARAADDPRP